MSLNQPKIGKISLTFLISLKMGKNHPKIIAMVFHKITYIKPAMLDSTTHSKLSKPKFPSFFMKNMVLLHPVLQNNISRDLGKAYSKLT
jgi:hypothetical protein